MPKLSLRIGEMRLVAETTGENPETVKAILERLPIKGFAERWGEEIYFFVPFDIAKGQQKQECEPGEIAYWPEGPAIAIFFGKTPLSKGEKPKAYSPCNFFARLAGKWDKGALNAVRDGTEITVDRAK